MSTHDIALICANGHLINSASTNKPEYNTDFCQECGAKTSNRCESCGADIQGAEISFHDFGNRRRKVILESKVPNYCHKCGMPYPWTEIAIQAALEYVDELELAEDEKIELKQSVRELTKNTPAIQVAALRFKRITMKAGSTTASAMRDILVEVLSEAAKKAIWPTS
ncbi:MAG: DUF2321 domain-containing protein [Chloroflexi bacterium]|nr:DUF2321 domain-containing protein [Chloroflexota bacterium]MCC6896685.1 DUF2321 domain-containing protein [Anaerolineae bacterium]